jgi:hypothetical protein
MQTYTTPEHDENSHGADALGEFAVNCRIKPTPVKEQKSDPRITINGSSSMTMNDLLKSVKKKQRYD